MSSLVNLRTFDSLCSDLNSDQILLEKTEQQVVEFSGNEKLDSHSINSAPNTTSSGELMQSTAAIFKHVENVQNSWRPRIGGPISKRNFKYHSLKRVEARQCEFTNADFTAAAASDSDWAVSTFKGCIFDDANFQLSNLEKCKFLPSDKRKTSIKGCNFFGTTLAGSTLSQCDIESSTFTSVDFSNANISNLCVKFSTFESVNFRNANLQQVDLSQSNVEYCDFTDATKKDLKLSLVQFAYTFGITYEDIQSGLVLLASDSEESGLINFEQLDSLLPPLIDYYQKNHAYFPCANLLYISKNDNFKQYIQEAIKADLLKINLQELKHLCRLARNADIFTSTELSELFELIAQRHHAGNHHQRHIWTLHEGDFRNHLLPASNANPILISINFSTRTNTSQIENIALLTQSMAEAFAILGYTLYCDKIEFTKNSPEAVNFTNCNVKQITINHIHAEKVVINQQTGATEHKKNSKILKSIHVIAAVVSILSGLTQMTKLTSDFQMNPQQQQEMLHCISRFNQNIIINDCTVNEGTSNRLGNSKDTIKLNQMI